MRTQRATYAYRYFVSNTEAPLQRCPNCHHDLTRPGCGVEIVLYYGDGKSEAGLVEVGSCLEEDGRLRDEEGQVAAGYHSTTLCFSCREQLCALADEEQTFSAGNLG